jgi:hypothetical protein
MMADELDQKNMTIEKRVMTRQRDTTDESGVIVHKRYNCGSHLFHPNAFLTLRD